MKSLTQKKFTLIELLVVVAIIGILVSILAPSLRKSIERAKRAVCLSSLKQMGIGTITYVKNNKGWTANWNNNSSNAAGGDNDGMRNLQYGDYKTGLGKTIAEGYLALDEGFLYCPSRVAKGRYSNFGYWALSKWDSRTVEYSYQHRRSRLLTKTNPDEVFGADIAIWDTWVIDGVNMGPMPMGDNFCHGDDYYNVQFFDLSARKIIDSVKVLETSNYNNRPGRVLNKFEDLAR